MSMSEIAQIRQQIDLEIAALNQVKHGYAAVAHHEVITHHYEGLARCLEQLMGEVGEEVAMAMLVEQMEQGI
jgi:hypothetical protein